MNRFTCNVGIAARYVVVVILAVAFVSSPVSVVAQGGDDGPSKEVAKRVLQIIREANQDFENGAYKSAQKGYRKAYSLYPDPVFQYRMGLTAEKLGNLREAMGHYEKFVEALPEDETAKKVADRLPELRANIPPKVAIRTDPAGADVRVGSLDSEVLGTTPMEIDAAQGTNKFYISLDDFKLVKKTLDLEGGDEEIIDIELEKLRAGSAEVDDKKEVTPPKEEETSSLATWGWITTGTGVAVLATGGVFTFLSQSKTDEVNDYDKQAPDASRAELQDLKDTASTFYDTAVAAYVTGGVLTATGVALLTASWLSPDGDAEALRFRLVPSKDGAFVGLSGSF